MSTAEEEKGEVVISNDGTIQQTVQESVDNAIPTDSTTPSSTNSDDD